MVRDLTLKQQAHSPIYSKRNVRDLYASVRIRLVHRSTRVPVPEADTQGSNNSPLQGLREKPLS